MYITDYVACIKVIDIDKFPSITIQNTNIEKYRYSQSYIIDKTLRKKKVQNESFANNRKTKIKVTLIPIN